MTCVKADPECPLRFLFYLTSFSKRHILFFGWSPNHLTMQITVVPQGVRLRVKKLFLYGFSEMPV
jgi:hypothetical protein